MFKVALFAPPRVQLLDVAGPADVFAEATTLLADGRGYSIEIVGVDCEPFRSASGMKISPDRSIRDRIDADTVLVAGAQHPHRARENSDVLEWIRLQAGQARRVGSVCSGAFFLAGAGLLDGRRVTTHWMHTAALAERIPTATVEPDAIFVRDGPISTSAGVTAGMDLALALVEEDFGRELALSAARRLVMFLKRPGGQSQFSAHLAAQTTARTPIETLQAWALENLAGDLSVETLARQSNMSDRNFGRVFAREAGMTPHEFVQSARVDAARRRLEDTDEPLKTVAQQVGFGSLANLRRAFVHYLNITPSDYRDRFRSSARAAQR